MRLLCAWAVLLVSTCAHAQSARRAELPVGLRFAATQANSPPGTCGCFWLPGAGVDIAVPLGHGFSAAVDLAGSTTKQVPSTTRGLSVITLLAGPRYTLPLGRRVSVQAQALFGVARGFDADFILTTGVHTDTASVFASAYGAAVEIPITRSLSLRAVQAEYLQTNLPNGIDNRQRNVRVGAGIIFHVPLPQAR